MGHPALQPYISYAEYLASEETSATKHEWLDGAIFDMAGGTIEHAALAASVIGLLSAELAGKRCRIFSSDLRVRVLETGLSTYPDVSVVCGHIERDQVSPSTAILNPTVIVEVLSDATEAYDRGEKFAHYRRIPSLREYVLVSQHEPHIEVFRKNTAGKWELSEEGRAGDTVPLASIECVLSVDEIFADPLRAG